MFRVGSRVRQETPEEGRRTHQVKRCEYHSKDKDDSSNNVNNNSNQNSSKKFRQINKPILVQLMTDNPSFAYPTFSLTSLYLLYLIAIS